MQKAQTESMLDAFSQFGHRLHGTGSNFQRKSDLRSKFFSQDGEEAAPNRLSLSLC